MVKQTKRWIKINLKMLKTLRATKRYGNKLYKKGKIYTIRRKLNKEDIEDFIRHQRKIGCKILSIYKTGW